MGKKGGGGSSWLTAVKRAFRSPSKETDNKTSSSSSKRREEHDHEDDEEKKREKRRWLFRKPATNQETVVVTHQSSQTPPPKSAATDAAPPTDHTVVASSEDEQRHAIAVAVASAAAAEAAVASVHAAVEVARLTRPQPPPTSNYHPRDHYAAIIIQTAFRGYLGRRALRALKGLVKLQALVRGHNVRKQAKMTLRCMQALVRVQARVLDQRMRLSHDGSSRKSTFSDTTSILESRYLQDISDRRTMSRDGSSIADDWDERPHTIEEVKAMLQHRKESALKREKTLSQAFSHQMWRNGRSSSIGNEEELQDKPQWLDRWMATKPWDSSGSRARASTDQRDPIKTVEIDTSQPYSYLPPNFRRSTTNIQNQQHQRPNSHTSIASPLHRSHHQAPPPHHHQHSPITPSPSKTRPVQVRSASPRCIREDRSYNSSSQTPSLRSNYYYTGNLNQQGRSGTSGGGGGGSSNNSSNATLPNYMAATESAKARVRSQSAPRQRPSTPERDRSGSVVKKRLSYPAPDPYGMGMGYGGGGGGGSYGPGLRSPSFKSITGSHFGGLEQQSNYSSCCTDSLAGAEISPSSTSDYRRWLR